MTGEADARIGKREVGQVRTWRATSSGMWAWLAQRLAAIALLPLIVLHVWFPYTLITQSLLIVVVVFHALLGIRVLLIDAGVSARYEKAIFGVVAIVGLVIMAFIGTAVFR